MPGGVGDVNNCLGAGFSTSRQDPASSRAGLGCPPGVKARQKANPGGAQPCSADREVTPGAAGAALSPPGGAATPSEPGPDTGSSRIAFIHR